MKIQKVAIIGLIGLTSLVGLSAIVAFFGFWVYLLAYLHHPNHKLRPHTAARTKLADNDAAYHRRLKKEPFYSGSGPERGVILFYDQKQGSELSPNYVAEYALDEKDIKDDNLPDAESVAHRIAATDLKKDTILTFYDLKPEEEKDLLLPSDAKDPDRKPIRTRDADVDQDGDVPYRSDPSPPHSTNPLEFLQEKKREIENVVSKMHQGIYLKQGVDQGEIIKESNLEVRKLEENDTNESKKGADYHLPVRDLTEVVGQRAYHNLRPGKLLRFGDFNSTNYAVISTKYLKPGTVLKADDLQVKEISWDLQAPDTIPDLHFLIGKKLVHGIPKNRIVTRWDLGAR